MGFACSCTKSLITLSSVAHPPTLPHLTGGSLGSFQLVSALVWHWAWPAHAPFEIARRSRSQKFEEVIPNQRRRTTPPGIQQRSADPAPELPGGVSCSSLPHATDTHYIHVCPRYTHNAFSDYIPPHGSHPRRTGVATSSQRRTHHQRSIFMTCGSRIFATWLGKLFRFYKILRTHYISSLPRKPATKNTINTRTNEEEEEEGISRCIARNRVHLWSTERPTRSKHVPLEHITPPTPKNRSARLPEGRMNISWFTIVVHGQRLSNADVVDRPSRHEFNRYSAANIPKAAASSTEAADFPGRAE